MGEHWLSNFIFPLLTFEMLDYFVNAHVQAIEHDTRFRRSLSPSLFFLSLFCCGLVAIAAWSYPTYTHRHKAAGTTKITILRYNTMQTSVDSYTKRVVDVRQQWEIGKEPREMAWIESLKERWRGCEGSDLKKQAIRANLKFTGSDTQNSFSQWISAC